MLKENSKIKVHMYDGIGYPQKKVESITRHYDKVFTVYKKNGKLGIDWNTEQSPYTCNGDVFTPFETFAPCVEFENISTGKCYHYSNLTNKLEAVN